MRPCHFDAQASEYCARSPSLGTAALVVSELAPCEHRQATPEMTSFYHEGRYPGSWGARSMFWLALTSSIVPSTWTCVPKQVRHRLQMGSVLERGFRKEHRSLVGAQ